MRKSFSVSIALATAAFAVSPALAQDGPAPFDGLYLGGSFGGAAQPNDVGSSILFDRDRSGSFGDTVVTGTNANAFAPGFCNGAARSSAPSTGCRNDKDGIEYAARVGFDKQSGHVVFGLMGEFGKAEINDSVTGYSITPRYYTMTRSLRYNAAVRARLGYAAGPTGTTLFYATGGGAYGRIRNTFTTDSALNSFSTNGGKNAYGYSVGGGVEQKLGEHFSIGLEYIYTDLKDDKARVGVGANSATTASNPFQLAGTGTDFRRSDDRFRWHSARVTAAFRF